MDLYYKFQWYLIRALLLGFLIYVGIRSVIGKGAWDLAWRIVSVVVGLWAVNLYDALIWAQYISPLRVYPEVVLHDMRYLLPVTDVPRGEAALQWAKKFPESDAIRVRTDPQTVLSLMSPRALRDVLSAQQDVFVKPISGRNQLSRVLGYGLILTEGATHARMRKTLNSAFRIQNIRALHDLMLEKTKVMIACMEEQQRRDGKVEVNDWASKTTLDIIGHSLMSQDFDSLRTARQPVNEAFGELTGVSRGLTMHFIASLFLPRAVVGALPTATNRMIERNMKIIRSACSASLDARGNNTQKASIGSEILGTILEDPKADRTEVIDQMLTFLGAGHDTTATSIAWAMHLLSLPEYLEHQDALRRELAANPDCTASATSLEALPFLNAVCEETLRLYPPVTTTGRISTRETTVAGVTIPKGTMLMMFPWAVNRHPKYWGGELAEKFVPGRWLDRLPDGKVRLNRHGGAESNYCDLTFLHGNRACIGRDFAKAELRCVLANIFGTFRVSRLPGDNLIAEPAGSVTIKPRDGLFVHLEKDSVLHAE